MEITTHPDESQSVQTSRNCRFFVANSFKTLTQMASEWVLCKILSGGVPLGLWDPYPIPDRVQLHFATLFWIRQQKSQYPIPNSFLYESLSLSGNPYSRLKSPYHLDKTWFNANTLLTLLPYWLSGRAGQDLNIWLSVMAHRPCWTWSLNAMTSTTSNQIFPYLALPLSQ